MPRPSFPQSPGLARAIAGFARSDSRKAITQICNTIIPYLALWAAMAFTVVQGLSYWITLVLAIPAGGLLVRIFILFHDCCHNAFFPSRRVNRIVGYCTGILTFTPFEDWRRTHSIHHSAAGNLDRRGTGDIWTLTVDEYRAASPAKRLGYRLFRNPVVLFGIIPICLFLVGQRFPSQGAGPRERRSVLLTNLAIGAIIIGLSLGLGFTTYLLVQLPILLIAAGAGMWLFYVQHQFEGVYWAHQEQWDPVRASLEGSSYYKLPKILQWTVGNIGFHHIHHLRANIPNYHLQSCFNAIPELRAIPTLTLRNSLKSLWLDLLDEQRNTLVSFRSIRSPSS